MASAYWEGRAAERQAIYDRASDEVAKRIYRAYDSAIKQFEIDMQNIFGNFAKFHNLKPEEARALLNEPANRQVLNALRVELSGITDETIRKELLARINAPAYAARISRLQAAREAAYVNMGKVADVSLKQVSGHLIDVTKEAYGQTLYGVQKNVGIMFQTAGMSIKRAQEIQRQVWSGAHYSKRLWGNSKHMAQLLTDAVQENAMAGKTSAQTFKALTEASAGGKYAANRLIRTETNYVAGQGEVEAYRDAGAEKYEFVAVLDGRTSTLCQDLDGKTFDVADQAVGVNMHPMHPWCRSTTAPVFGWEDRSNMMRRARDPKTGQTMVVPASMTYKQWKENMG
jgi:SPP1 gp7 family putative phage head morphogenesis protein